MYECINYSPDHPVGHDWFWLFGVCPVIWRAVEEDAVFMDVIEGAVAAQLMMTIPSRRLFLKHRKSIMIIIMMMMMMIIIMIMMINVI